MIRGLADIVSVAALQRALIDMDDYRLGSAAERRSAYAQASLTASEVLDAEACRTERVRRRVAVSQPSFLRRAA
jgi:hypothetical protein